MRPGSKFALYWLFGLALRLVAALVLAVVLCLLWVYLLIRLHLPKILPTWHLPALLLLVGYTWAVYFRLPFFRNRSRPQRIFLSSGLAALFIFMTYWGGMAALFVLLNKKTDRRVETVTLPSGEVLENHTYLEEGWGDERYNALFLKNPATGVSEPIDDPLGHLNYESAPGEPSLFQRYPHPQEFVRGDEKVLLIGPFACKRWIQQKKSSWDLFRFDTASHEEVDYVRSFWKPTDPAPAARMASGTFSPGEGPECFLHYQFDSLNLENNILTVKLAQPNDEFPDYLVYSACDYKGDPSYNFPWKFDLARTRAKNGPQWVKPMPYRMALDYSVVTFRGLPGIPFDEKHDIAMTRPSAKEIATAILELSDQELRSAECQFTIDDTNRVVEKFKAMYGFADAQTNRFNILWQPHVNGAFPVSSLRPGEWVIVGESSYGTNCVCDRFIRIHRMEP